MHRKCDTDLCHDEETDRTDCYDLSPEQAHVARLLGHDVRHGHARLTSTERRRIGEVMAWAEGVASGLSGDLSPAVAFPGLPGISSTAQGNSGRFRESA